MFYQTELPAELKAKLDEECRLRGEELLRRKRVEEELIELGNVAKIPERYIKKYLNVNEGTTKALYIPKKKRKGNTFLFFSKKNKRSKGLKNTPAQSSKAYGELSEAEKAALATEAQEAADEANENNPEFEKDMVLGNSFDTIKKIMHTLETSYDTESVFFAVTVDNDDPAVDLHTFSNGANAKVLEKKVKDANWLKELAKAIKPELFDIAEESERKRKTPNAVKKENAYRALLRSKVHARIKMTCSVKSNIIWSDINKEGSHGIKVDNWPENVRLISPSGMTPREAELLDQALQGDNPPEFYMAYNRMSSINPNNSDDY